MDLLSNDRLFFLNVGFSTRVEASIATDDRGEKTGDITVNEVNFLEPTSTHLTSEQNESSTYR